MTKFWHPSLDTFPNPGLQKPIQGTPKPTH
jgi:hypothetical protein